MAYSIADVNEMYAYYPAPPISQWIKNWSRFSDEELSDIFAGLTKDKLDEFVDITTLGGIQDEFKKTVTTNINDTVEACKHLAITNYQQKQQAQKRKITSADILRKMLSAKTLTIFAERKFVDIRPVTQAYVDSVQKVLTESLYFSTKEAHDYLGSHDGKYYVLDIPQVATILATQFQNCIIQYNRSFDDCKRFTPYESLARNNGFDTTIFISLLQGQGLLAQKERLEREGHDNVVTVTKKAKKAAVNALKQHLSFSDTEALQYVANAQGHHVLEIPTIAPVVNATFNRCIIEMCYTFAACQGNEVVNMYEVYQMMIRKEDRQALLGAQGLLDKSEFFNNLAKNASDAKNNPYCHNPKSICYDPSIVLPDITLPSMALTDITPPVILDMTPSAIADATPTPLVQDSSYSVGLKVVGLLSVGAVALLVVARQFPFVAESCVKVGSIVESAVKTGFGFFKTQYNRVVGTELEDQRFRRAPIR